MFSSDAAVRLAIGVGNSTIVAAAFRGEALLARADTARDAQDAIARASSEIARLAREHGAASAVLCSVVPALDAAVVRAAHDAALGAPVVVTAADVDWFAVAYDPPGALGADRLCNVIALRERYGRPGICVDFGTATTIGIVDDAGDFAGGAIGPGIASALRAMHDAGAQLPRIAFDGVPPRRARATADGMRAGAYWVVAEGVHALVDAYRAEWPGAPVIATGGLARFALEAFGGGDWRLDPELTLRGAITYAARKGRGGRSD